VELESKIVTTYYGGYHPDTMLKLKVFKYRDREVNKIKSVDYRII